jgi:hypothetical protein
MATEEEIASLRRRTAEPTDEHYTDDALETLIDTYGFNDAVGEVWAEKAARFSALVDVTEGSSSRRMSQMHAHALKMAGQYGKVVDGGAGIARVHRINRT